MPIFFALTLVNNIMPTERKGGNSSVRAQCSTPVFVFKELKRFGFIYKFG